MNTNLTNNQMQTLVQIRDTGHSSGASLRTISSLRWNHQLITPANLGNPHPTNPLAMWCLTAAGQAELQERNL